MKLHAAAMAALRSAFDYTVPQLYDTDLLVFANGDYGPQTVHALVGQWLASDEGQSFSAPKRPTHYACELVEAIRSLHGHSVLFFLVFFLAPTGFFCFLGFCLPPTLFIPGFFRGLFARSQRFEVGFEYVALRVPGRRGAPIDCSRCSRLAARRGGLSSLAVDCSGGRCHQARVLMGIVDRVLLKPTREEKTFEAIQAFFSIQAFF